MNLSKETDTLISVVTVSYNAVSTIEQTILSVINQTYPNVEYVIIDGGSTDGTVDVIKKYADRISYWVSEPDKGIYDAMNKGIDRITGEWVNFMNSGDIFYDKNVIENIFLENKLEEVNVIYGDSRLNFLWGDKIIKPDILNNILSGMIFIHQSSFIRTKQMKKYKYETKYKLCADYNFFLKCFQENSESFKYIPLLVSIYDAESGLSSQNKIRLLNEKHDIHKSLLKKSDSFSYSLSLLEGFTKLFLKILIPTSWMDIIRRWNINRIHNS